MRGRFVAIAAGLVLVALLGVRFALRDEAPRATRSDDGPQTEESVLGSAPAPARAPLTAPNRPSLALRDGGTAPQVLLDPPAPSSSPTDGGPARTTEALVAALGSRDDFVVLDAADHLAERKVTQALPTLVAIDIKGRANAAPSVIDALGRLAGAADPATRRSATDRLLELLVQERARDAPESPGNVLGLYAALGHTLDPRAAPALEAELLDPKVTLAAKTVIVEALIQLKQGSSRSALLALQRELAGYTPKDDLEGEIQRELAVAIDRALRALP